jgi:geranylgeranyl pyrophosphate synthase
MISTANICLGYLETDIKTLQNILMSLGSAWSLSAKAQSYDLKEPSFEFYFSKVISSTACLFAAISQSGAMLAPSIKPEQLKLFWDFGYNTGVSAAILADCNDLEFDLSTRTYTLPILYAISQKENKHHQSLTHLLQQPQLTTSDIATIINILSDMKAINRSKVLAQQYQKKSLAVIEALPYKEKANLIHVLSQ